ncbi:MAG: NAD-dependent deacylase [Planctomycetia bacterium]|nr:NAD-dependent deacylase [Planctomycetia bacterium]
MTDGVEQSLSAAVEALNRARSVAVLSGAGVSAESGIPTFRAADGLWEGHRIEDVATPSGFQRDPRLVWKFYNARRANARSVKPNPGHLALAAMERHWVGRFAIATQNVDGLHQAAGSRTVYEVHGCLRRTRCTGCGEIRDRGLDPLPDLPQCEGCGAMLRPDIVWFHESLPDDVWWNAQQAAASCDVLLVVGTSAVVYPAASLIPIAQQSRDPGATVIECNLARTEASQMVDIGLYGPSGITLPTLCQRLGIEVP